jgi:hypothetical protein
MNSTIDGVQHLENDGTFQQAILRPPAAPPSLVSVEVPINAFRSLWLCRKLVPNNCHPLPQYQRSILQCTTSYVWVKMPTDVWASAPPA